MFDKHENAVFPGLFQELLMLAKVLDCGLGD
jgi:hypothetical protein